MNATTATAAPARFSELGISPTLCSALERNGITSAFPIQTATLPDCLAGRDVCGKAPTGSGKTLAFGLAVLSRLEAKPQVKRRGRQHPSTLVLVPTRELASQIEAVIAPLAEAIGARVTSVYGGVGYGGQLNALRRGVDVLVACPGRLIDLLERGSVNLSHVDAVVVDEADRMADMGFLPAVRRLLDQTSASRQTLLFSATLDGPVDKLVRDYQRNPTRHEVQLDEGDLGQVDHHFWRVESGDRVSVTAEAIAARGPAVVFCRTKRGADRLSDRLARSGLASAAIHGDRSQAQRERALASFRNGRLDVLVATDVAARGIHVDAVPLVVHFDPPSDPTDYVHRSGRTGRAGANGIVVSMVGNQQIGGARLVQQRLGLSTGVTAPDVSSLALVEGQVRSPSAPRGNRETSRQPQNANRKRPAFRQGQGGNGSASRPNRRKRHGDYRSAKPARSSS